MADHSDDLIPVVLASTASPGSLADPASLPSLEELLASKGNTLHRPASVPALTAAQGSGEAEHPIACEDEDDAASTWGKTQRPKASPSYCMDFNMNGPGCKQSACLGCKLAEVVRSRQAEVTAGCRQCGKTCTREDVRSYNAVCNACFQPPACACQDDDCGRTATRVDVSHFGGVCNDCWKPPTCACPDDDCSRMATRDDVRLFDGVCNDCWKPPTCACPDDDCSRMATRSDVRFFDGVCNDCWKQPNCEGGCSGTVNRQGFLDYGSICTGCRGGVARVQHSDFFFKKSQDACARPFLCAFPGCSTDGKKNVKSDFADRSGVRNHARTQHNEWLNSGGVRLAVEYICGQCSTLIVGNDLDESVGCSTCTVWLHLRCSGFTSPKAAAAESAVCYCRTCMKPPLAERCSKRKRK